MGAGFYIWTSSIGWKMKLLRLTELLVMYEVFFPNKKPGIHLLKPINWFSNSRNEKDYL